MYNDITEVPDNVLLAGIEVGRRSRDAYSDIMNGLHSLVTICREIGDIETMEKYSLEITEYYRMDSANLETLRDAYKEKERRGL